MIPVHIATGDSGSYYLKENSPQEFQWFLEDQPTEIKAPSIREAMKLAIRAFKFDHFNPLPCGNKYSLPERDEHGEPALFSELVKSLASPNGQYFDPLYGQNYIVKEFPLNMRDKALTHL